MAQRYDAVVIGGGHNGLVTAAPREGRQAGRGPGAPARAGRRGGLGGDRPGYRFSVFSYVVSLLRPEIVRGSSCRSTGSRSCRSTERSPLDDDALWRVNDHGRTVRELRRWSLNDAEAYEEYGPLMARWRASSSRSCRCAAGPRQGLGPDWLPLTPLAKTFKDLPKRLQTTFIQLMTMSAADFLDQWFETEPLKATMSASGSSARSRGRDRRDRLRAAPPLHG